MRKLISSINVTLDGFCDHTAVIADEDLHENANELLRNAGTMIFGRKTYQLMEAGWPPVVQNPTGQKAVDEFAVLIDNMPKIVFSHTLKTVTWKNITLADGNLEETMKNLKLQLGKDILVGGPTLIVTLTKAGLIDEFQFCFQPIILGQGLPLFKNISDRVDLKLLKTKTLASGVLVNNYALAGR